MNIVVLDGQTLNPGDLNWTELEKLGNCQIHNRSNVEEILDRSKDADILIVNKVVIGKKEIEQLPNLKYIGLSSTGYNVVDIDTARDHNIMVTNVPAYSTLSVAQMAFAHILNLCHHVDEHSTAVKNGDWIQAPDFCFWNFPLIELQDKTLGIIGFGRIGQAVAAIAKAMGMQVIYYDTNEIQSPPPDCQPADLDTIFKESDILSLHCPLTPENEQFINQARLEMMKSSAFLINTSRGQLINEQDLADALNTGTIAGAGLDVLSVEPPPADNPLLSAKNCYITPHIAWATSAARQRLMNVVVGNVRAFLNGQPVNVVNSVK